MGEHLDGGNCRVNSWNEWDPLEEVIVGTAWGAHVPSGADAVSDGHSLFGLGGSAFPIEVIHRIQEQIERFVSILKAEGVDVQRPSIHDLSLPIQSPHFSVPCGYNFMNARDLVLIVGDQIIEAPTASQSRYFETLAYRPLFKEYFRSGARWVSAPKPELSASSFNSPEARERFNLTQEVTSEYEPLFDAADFVRCGYDIIGQRGARTNCFGLEWLRRHLGSEFSIHEISTQCRFSVHIDTTFVPLGPNRALVNRDWIGKLPGFLNGWEIIDAPKPEGTTEPLPGYQYETSPYIAMNVFLLDEKRVFVDAQQKKLIRILKEHGMDPIDIPFDLPPILGGAFHCATLDVRRRSSG